MPNNRTRTSKGRKWHRNHRGQLARNRPISEVAFHERLKGLYKPPITITAQRPVGPYFVDLALRKGRRTILIEIDGGYHSQLKQHLIDIQKTDYFMSQGFSVWRMTPEVSKNITDAEIVRIVSELFHKQDVVWMNWRDIQHHDDPAAQFMQRIKSEEVLHV